MRVPAFVLLWIHVGASVFGSMFVKLVGLLPGSEAVQLSRRPPPYRCRKFLNSILLCFCSVVVLSVVFSKVFLCHHLGLVCLRSLLVGVGLSKPFWVCRSLWPLSFLNSEPTSCFLGSPRLNLRILFSWKAALCLV